MIAAALQLQNDVNCQTTVAALEHSHQQTFAFNLTLLKHILDNIHVQVGSQVPALLREDTRRRDISSPPREHEREKSKSELRDEEESDSEDVINWEKEEEDAMNNFERILETRLTDK